MNYFCNHILAGITACVLMVNSAWAEDDIAASEGIQRLAIQEEAVEEVRLFEDVPVELHVNMRSHLGELQVAPYREGHIYRNAPTALELTMSDSIAQALVHNPDLLIKKQRPHILHGSYLVQRAVFDPKFTVDAWYEHDENEQRVGSQVGGLFPSTLADNEDNYTVANITLSDKWRFGTEVELSYGVRGLEENLHYPYPQPLPPFVRQFGLGVLANRPNNLINSAASALTQTYPVLHDEIWTAGFELYMMQPLLKGRGRKVNLAELCIALNNRERAVEEVRRATLDAVANVAMTYWELVGAAAIEELLETSMNEAEALVDQSEEIQAEGVTTALDVIQSRSGLAERQESLVEQQQLRRDIEDELKVLMGLQRGVVLEDALIIPLNVPGSDVITPDEYTSLDLAMAYRPESRDAELAIDSAQHHLYWTENNRKPTLNVMGEVRIGGGSDISASDAIRNSTSGDQVDYFIGLYGKYPIRNRDAKGRHHRAKAYLEEAERQEDRLEIQFAKEVRTAIRALESAKIRIRRADQTRELDQISFEAEKQRLKLGDTTSFHILLVENGLTAAQVKQVRSRIAYEQAIIQLHHAQGTLLQHFGIAFEAPEYPVH